jgi:hypothetical protein
MFLQRRSLSPAGKVLRKVQTESSNNSGIAFGNGYLWMAATGKAVGRVQKAGSGRLHWPLRSSH